METKNKNSVEIFPTKEATFGLYKKQFEASIEFSKEHNRLIVPWRFEVTKSEFNFSLDFYIEYIQPILKYNAWYGTEILEKLILLKWQPGIPCNGQHTVLFWLFPDGATIEQIEKEVNTGKNKFIIIGDEECSEECNEERNEE
jgi:hypothetical protein